MFAEIAAFSVAFKAGDIGFDARFREGEEGRAETDFALFAEKMLQ